MKLKQVVAASKDELIQEIDRLRDKLWHAGVCADCGEEIQHDITEPFASCSCGTGEATYVPTIPQLRYELSGVPLLREQVRVGDICSHYHMKRARLCEQANELANEMVQAMAGEIERAYTQNGWEPWMFWGLVEMHATYVEDHMAGSVEGVKCDPLTREQADIKWITDQHHFVRLITQDHEVRTKMKATWDAGLAELKRATSAEPPPEHSQ